MGRGRTIWREGLVSVRMFAGLPWVVAEAHAVQASRMGGGARWNGT